MAISATTQTSGASPVRALRARRVGLRPLQALPSPVVAFPAALLISGIDRHGFPEPDKEIIGDLFGCAVDQALADLGELAADGGLGRVGERRATFARRQQNIRLTPRKAGHAALSFALQLAAPRRIEILERDIGFERRLDRADFEGRRGAEMGRIGLFHVIAPRNALTQHVRIIQGGPDLFRRGRDWIAAFKFHGRVVCET